jgi:8-oxo-dGTP pyrophosphatase MutT (NUDIX family)
MQPRNAAGLVLLRAEGRPRPEVLLGRRSAAMVFMPGYHVFPGGRVEEDEPPLEAPSDLPLPEGLDAASRALLPALRATALRELEEETGLRLHASQAGCLRPIARAITPPGNPRRFDTRFFAVLEPRLEGEILGDGELEDIGWVSVDRLDSIPLARISGRVLREALAYHADPRHPFQQVTDASSLG